jgi:hypothetical protein
MSINLGIIRVRMLLIKLCVQLQADYKMVKDRLVPINVIKVPISGAGKVFTCIPPGIGNSLQIRTILHTVFS